MDEMNEWDVPAAGDAVEVCCEASGEPESGKPRRGRFLHGLISGTIVGGALAMVLAPLKGEERIPTTIGGGPSGRKGMEEEGRLRAMVAMERAQSLAGRVKAGVIGAWAAVRERLRDAVEEGKEGIAEGEAEARLRFESKTKRRRQRKS